MPTVNPYRDLAAQELHPEDTDRRKSGRVTQADGTPAPSPIFEAREEKPKVNPYSNLAAQEAKIVEITRKAELTEAAKGNPDEAAKAAKIAEKKNIPMEVAARNLLDLELQEAVEKADQKLKTSPKLAEALHKKPDIVKQAVDDLETLADLDNELKRLKAKARPADTPDNVIKGLAKAPLRGMRNTAEGLRLAVKDVLDEAGLRDRTEAEIQMDIKRAAIIAQEAANDVPDIKDPTLQAIYGGFSSLVQQLPAMAVSIVTGNPIPLLASAGAQESASSYTRFRERGASVGEATVGALGSGSVEVLTELAPGVDLVKNFGVSSVRRVILGQLAKDIPGEQVATVAQDAIDTAIANNDPDRWKKYIEGRPMAAYQTLVSSVTQGIASGGLSGAVRNVARQQGQQQKAKDDAKQLSNAITVATQSKLRERNPAAFREVLDELVGTDETENREVFIDAEVLNQIMPDEKLAQILPSALPQLKEALASGGLVSVSLGEVLTNLPDSGLEQQFLENMRATPDAPTLLEADEGAKQAEEFLQNAANAAIEAADNKGVVLESQEQVKTKLLSQLDRAGRFRPEVNEAYATMVSEFFTATSMRVGKLPHELYDLYPLKITSKLDGSEVLAEEAPRKPGQISVEGYHFSTAERKALASAAFGTGLQGSARDTFLNAEDQRLRHRIYFYANKGTGINPEAGVGGYVHKARLDNVYDANSDPLRLRERAGGQMAFEAAVLDAGFDGYLDRLEGTQSGQVILLGNRHVTPEFLGSGIDPKTLPAAPVPAPMKVEGKGRDKIVDALRANKNLPMGQPTLGRWRNMLKALAPNELQALEDAGVFEGDLEQPMYRDDLIRRFQTLTPDEVYNQLVSTRIPTAKKATEDHLGETLVVGMESLERDPRAFEKNVRLVTGYENMPEYVKDLPVNMQAETFVEHAKENLLWLHDQVPPETAARSRLWYDGARRIAEQWAPKYGLTDSQTAGVLAVLSPQKDWFMNVTLAERVLDTMTEKRDHRWDDQMQATAERIFPREKYPTLHELLPGKTLAELENEPDADYLQAAWVRTYDQAHNPRHHRIVSPEGNFEDFAKNADGVTPTSAAWGGLDAIGKAVSIIKNGEHANISAQLGDMHKVRNFYNNIFDPNSDTGAVTIDTHAVAAALVQPLSGNSPEVLHNFGGKGSAESSMTGNKGTYPLFAEAYRRAAAERGILPREMQSITWEAVRGLFVPTFKSQKKNVQAVKDVWNRVKKGELNVEQARNEIAQLAGGINLPDWHRPSDAAHGGSWSSSYAGNLLADGGADGAAGPGAGKPAAPAVPADGRIRGTLLNVGLDIPGGGRLTPEQVLAAIEAHGRRVASHTIQESDSETTVIAEIDSPLDADTGTRLSSVLQQEAIAQFTGKNGDLFGPMAEKWGPFNPDFFVLPDGRRASEALGDDFFQAADGNVRGTFNPKALQISLLEGADLSTFLHESGHFFLEVLADLGSKPGMAPGVKADLMTVMNWFGVKSVADWQTMSLDEKRKYHEKFAEGFEQYVMEGKAPSIRLRPLFARFRSWLLNVYRSLREFMGAYNTGLNTEVRAVFDRMLASDEQIKAAEQMAGFEAIFKSPEEAGMTPEQWQEYQRSQAEATHEAIASIQSRSIKDLKWTQVARSKKLRELAKDVKAKRDTMRAEVEAEVKAMPIVRAREFLAEATAPTAEEKAARGEWKAKREHAKAQFVQEVQTEYTAKADEQKLKGLEKAQFMSRSKKLINNEAERRLILWERENPAPKRQPSQVELQMVADMFGFGTAEDLQAALMDTEPTNVLVEHLTDIRMLQKYGEMATPDGIERAANAAIHNEARARAVATEFAAMNKGLGATIQEGKRKVNATMAAAKGFAERIVAGRKIMQLRPHLNLAAEARAAKKAGAAMAQGKTAEAIDAKRDQLLSHYVARFSQRELDNAERGLEYLRKFEKESVREKLPPEYAEQIDAILDRFDLRKSTSRSQIARRHTLMQWVEQQREMGIEPPIDPKLLDEARLTSWRELTVEEFKGLVDSVKAIDHLGRLKQKLLKAKDQREFAAVVAEAEASIRENATRSREERMDQPTKLERMQDYAREYIAEHRKAASIIRELDGFKDDGPMWRIFNRGMNEAADMEADMRAKASKALIKILKPVQGQLTKKVMVKEVGQALSLEARLSVALNWGNETNRKRVLDGNRWTTAQAHAVMATLTPEQMDMVQKTWDYIDTYWPLIAEKEKRVTGVVPEKVDAEPFTVTLLDGTEVKMKGGYYPIKYDPRRSTRQEQADEADVAKRMLQGAFTRSTTKRGHTEHRVDRVERALRTDLGVITQHMNEVIHDLSWHEWLIDANRILRAEPIGSAIRQTMGPEYLNELRELTKDIAAGDVGAVSPLEKGLAWLRSGASIAGLGWNLKTALLQGLGLTQSAVRIGSRWVGRGAARFIANPNKAAGFAQEHSKFMATRALTMNREINETFNELRNHKQAALERSFFYFIQKGQQVVDTITWIGAYEKALAEGKADDLAVALADQAVRDAQGGGQTSDLARIQRGGPLKKLFTTFYSFFNTTLNLTIERARDTDWKKPTDVARFTTDMLLLYSLPAALGTLLTAAMSGDDEDLAEKLARDQLGYAMGTIVGLREVSGVVQGYNAYQGPAGARFFGELSKLGVQVGQGEVDEPALRAANNVAGMVLHYPAGQVARTVDGMIALQQGETSNPGALIVGGPRD